MTITLHPFFFFFFFLRIMINVTLSLDNDILRKRYISNNHFVNCHLNFQNSREITGRNMCPIDDWLKVLCEIPVNLSPRICGSGFFVIVLIYCFLFVGLSYMYMYIVTAFLVGGGGVDRCPLFWAVFFFLFSLFLLLLLRYIAFRK